MTEVEEMGPVKGTTVVPDKCVWVCLYWTKDYDRPMTMYGYNKQDVLKWAMDSSTRDPDQNIKIYRLDY